MPDDNANLKDALNPPEVKVAAATAVVVPDPAKVVADAADKAAEADALEIGKLLLGSGVTKEKVNELLQAPQALQSLRYLMDNNPDEFYTMIERNSPGTADKLLESAADRYVKRYGKPEGSDGKETPTNKLMGEVKDLREQIGQIRSAEEQRRNASAVAQVQSRYEARVDDLLTQIPKEMGLTKSETKNIKARLNQELANDPDAVKRVSNGNFVDVPMRFKSIIEEMSTDKKSAADAQKSARERSKSAAFSEILGGPNPLLVDVPTNFADSWDSTEDALAKALAQTGA